MKDSYLSQKNIFDLVFITSGSHLCCRIFPNSSFTIAVAPWSSICPFFPSFTALFPCSFNLLLGLMNQLFPSIRDDEAVVESTTTPPAGPYFSSSSTCNTPTKFQALTAINLNLLKHSQILYSPHSSSRRPSLQLAVSLYSQGTDVEEERHSPTQPILIGQYQIMDEKTTEIVNALEYKNNEMLTLIKSSTTPRGSIVAVSNKSSTDAHSHHERRGSTRSDQLTHTDTTEDLEYDDDEYLIGDAFLDEVDQVAEDLSALPISKLPNSKSSQKLLYPSDEDDLDEDIFGMEL